MQDSRDDDDAEDEVRKGKGLCRAFQDTTGVGVCEYEKGLLSLPAGVASQLLLMGAFRLPSFLVFGNSVALLQRTCWCLVVNVMET